jgi:hypothetical protein
MYIVVSTSYNYKGTVIGYDCINRAQTIGHEIGITRPILLFLLSQNLVTINDTIVTISNQRFFLYSKIFKNIIDYDSIPDNTTKDDILYLTDLNSLTEKFEDLDFILDAERKFKILKDIRSKNVIIKTGSFNDYVAQIQYIDIPPDFLTRDFVIVHSRHTNYDRCSDVDETKLIIDTLLSTIPAYNIIIFSNIPYVTNCSSVLIVNHMPLYASLMNHDNCKGVISQFSGAGQLAQYCHNKNIFYYAKAYDIFKGDDLVDVFRIANEPTNIYKYFDCQKITHSNVFAYANIFDLVNDFKANFLKYSIEVELYGITNKICRVT